MQSMARSPGRPRKEDTCIMYIRVPKALAELVRAEAIREKRGITATFEVILERYFARNEQPAEYTYANRD